MSVVSIMGACRFDGSWASGTSFRAAGSLGVHWFAPAGLVVSSQSYLNRLSRYPLSHFVGSLVQAPSSPLVMVSGPLPVPKVFFQPKPWYSTGHASGSGPTYSEPAAPWHLPKVWPPTMSASVSSSFIAIRRKVSRMSLAAASGSGLPLGPSGFT